MSRRTTAVVELRPADLLDTLHAALGHLTAITDVALLLVPSGHAVVGTAGTGVAVTGARVVIDLSDAALDELRLVAHGASGGVASTVRAVDVTDGTVVAQLTLTASGTVTGDWTSVARNMTGDRTIELRVTGNGVATQTLQMVRLQGRTLRFQP